MVVWSVSLLLSVVELLTRMEMPCCGISFSDQKTQQNSKERSSTNFSCYQMTGDDCEISLYRFSNTHWNYITQKTKVKFNIFTFLFNHTILESWFRFFFSFCRCSFFRNWKLSFQWHCSKMTAGVRFRNKKFKLSENSIVLIVHVSRHWYHSNVYTVKSIALLHDSTMKFVICNHIYAYQYPHVIFFHSIHSENPLIRGTMINNSHTTA